MADDVSGAGDFGDLVEFVQQHRPGVRDDVRVQVLIPVGEETYLRMEVKDLRFYMAQNPAHDRVFVVLGAKAGYAVPTELQTIGLMEKKTGQ